MNTYTFPRLRRLHRTAGMWPEWFFDLLHLATCELEAGGMRRLGGAWLLNGPLPDTEFRHRSHVAAVAEAEGQLHLSVLTRERPDVPDDEPGTELNGDAPTEAERAAAS